MSKVAPITVLRRRLEGKTQAALAEELGISIGHLADMLSGRRAVGPKVLKELGLERITRVAYRELPDDQTAA